MSESNGGAPSTFHSHVFLGEGHEQSKRKTWAVIWLCGAMMIAEIVGGVLFGSIALVADGMHMSTHAGALLLAALAYSYARKHAHDPRFTFGTGKLGDLAGFTSAIILAMIALLIGYEAVSRIFSPITIHFAEAIPIACLGLAVNLGSAWLLSGGNHHHGHSHGLAHGNERYDHGQAYRIATDEGVAVLEIFEDGVPPRFRLRAETGAALAAGSASIETVRPDGKCQLFALADRGRQQEALPCVREAAGMIGDIHDPGERHHLAGTLGQAEDDVGLHADAQRHYEQALAAARRAAPPDRKPDLSHGLRSVRAPGAAPASCADC